jgi:hypothetical protein
VCTGRKVHEQQVQSTLSARHSDHIRPTHAAGALSEAQLNDRALFDSLRTKAMLCQLLRDVMAPHRKRS